eukprot:sb/3466806/
MELWNVRTMKLIYQFTGLTGKITVLAQSPAIDIVGVGCSDGKIHIHNLRTDEKIMSFYQDWGCVKTLSFRSDGVAHMVSGSTEGHIAIWDLEKQQLHSMNRSDLEMFLVGTWSILSRSKKLNLPAEDLKLTPVTALSAEEIREREWSNVMTAHVGDKNVRLWSTCNATLNNKPLIPKLDNIVVSAVCLTSCGHIGVVGIWEFSPRTLLSIVDLPGPATKLTLHRESGLAAVSLDGGCVVVVDVDTSRIVRKFHQSATVTDMCYSKDCKWLVVATSDRIIRIWDLATSRLIDCFQTPSLVSSVSVSPEHLVTTHQGELGVCLW